MSESSGLTLYLSRIEASTPAIRASLQIRRRAHLDLNDLPKHCKQVLGKTSGPSLLEPFTEAPQVTCQSSHQVHLNLILSQSAVSEHLAKMLNLSQFN